MSVDHITSTLQSDVCEALQNAIGFKDDIAKPLADAIVKKIQASWGGREIYIPVDRDNVERNQAIKAQFNGRNHDEICRSYDISPRTLYRVIQRS